MAFRLLHSSSKHQDSPFSFAINSLFKRSNNPIANRAVQEVVASISHYKAHRGIVITNNSFTKAAIELAKSNNIELIDRTKLSNLIKEFLW